MLNKVKDIKKTADILLNKRLKLWEEKKYEELICEAEMNDKQLPKRNAHITEEDAYKNFNRLALQGKLRSACRFITERESGVRVMTPDEKIEPGKTNVEGLQYKHPEQAEVHPDAFEQCDELPYLVKVDITAAHVEKAARSLSRGAGPTGVDGDQMSSLLQKYGSQSAELRISFCFINQKIGKSDS